MPQSPSVSESVLISSVVFGGQGISNLPSFSVDDFYSDEAAWWRVIRRASQNRVLYYFAKELMSKYEPIPPQSKDALSRIISEGNQYLARLRQTLQFVDQVLTDARTYYLVVRTDKYIPFVTFDVDVFVDEADFARAQEVLRKAGVVITSHDGALGGRLPGAQVNCRKEGLLNIDLHQHFTWQKYTYVDKIYVWENTRHISIEGVKCPVPSLEAELLLNMAHLLNERFYLTLLDLVDVVFTCRETLDIDRMCEQTRKHGWATSFAKSMSLVDTITNTLGLDAQNDNVKRMAQSAGLWNTGSLSTMVFPYFLPLPFVIKDVFLEKWSENKHFDTIAFMYYCYVMGRYFTSRRKRMPYYEDWYSGLKNTG